MDRRAFIRLTAISGTSAAIAACGTPEHQLIRFVPDEDIVPGIAVWKPSVCPCCPAGCGLTVRVMDADADVVRNGQAGVVRILAAKKLEGTPAHPVNRGGLCARGQAAIQLAYHPDRITAPLARDGDRGAGRYKPISWDEAIGQVAARLNALTAAGRARALAMVTRRGASHRQLLTAAFLERFGAPPPAAEDLFGDNVLRRANALSFDHREQLPTIDLAQARHVISFGADLLGTWNSPVSQSASYGEMRQGRRGVRGVFIQVEPRLSQSGANADEWIPAKPGTEGMLALGLAHAIMAAKLRPAAAAGRAGALIDGWSSGLPQYTPDRVEAACGVAAARVERIARTLAEEGPSVGIIGGAPLAHTNGLFNAVAVNALTALLGSIDRPGGLSFMPQIDAARTTKLAGAARPAGSVKALADAALGGGASAPQVLLIDGANPVFTSPPAWRMAEALAATPFIVSFGSFLDETSALADLILPDHAFLETWTDALPESGAAVAVMSAAPPAMKPLHDTRAMPDVLLEIGTRLDPPIAFPWPSFEEMLGASFGALPAPGPDTDAWSDAQEKGGWWGTPPAALVKSAPTGIVAPLTVAATGPQFDGDAAQFPLHLLPYASAAFLDGSLAHLPWLQEMPDPITSAMWSSWIEINPATAARLGIAQGDVVEVSSSQGTLRSRAVISPGVAPDVVAMPIGQGHRTFTRYATGRGENPLTLVAPLADTSTGGLAWAATRVRVSRAGGPDGGLVLFAGGMREERDRSRH